MLLKNLLEGEEPDKGTYHPTAIQMLSELNVLKSENADKLDVLNNLEQFYRKSQIFRALGLEESVASDYTTIDKEELSEVYCPSWVRIGRRKGLKRK